MQILAATDEEDARLRKALADCGIQWEDTAIIPPFTSPVTLEESPDPTIYRAISKIAFNYAVAVLGAPYMAGQDFNPVRNYVRNGNQVSWPVVVPLEKPDFDSASPFATANGHILILNWSMFAEATSLVALVALFNMRYFRVQLSGDIRGLFLDVRRGHYFDISAKPRQCRVLDEAHLNQVRPFV